MTELQTRAIDQSSLSHLSHSRSELHCCSGWPAALIIAHQHLNQWACAFSVGVVKIQICNMSSSESISSPEARSESRGSSVSTGLREEYDDLLRYAVVMPVVNTTSVGGPRHKTGDPTPRANQPPRPHTPPRHASRNKMKAEGTMQ